MEKPRDKLIATAIKLFAEKGYDGTTVNDLAADAGANVALISYHFGGKEGLLGAVLDQIANDKFQSAERLLADCTSAEDFRLRLEHFVSGMLDFFFEQRALIKVLLHELELGFGGAEQAYGKGYEAVVTRLAAFLEHARGKGFIDPQTDVKVALLILLTPMTSMVRSEKSIAKYLDLSLENAEFRKALARGIVKSI